jgi:hypothetical protein
MSIVLQQCLTVRVWDVTYSNDDKLQTFHTNKGVHGETIG